MNNLRTYGKKPFSIAVIHGGPGAGGEMAPVAVELTSLSHWGVLEPIQTATSIDGQINEMKTILKKNGDFPILLIGFSWGAWLSYLFAAHYPAFIKKLILIGSGPFKENYVEILRKTRIGRLSENERISYDNAIKIVSDPSAKGKTAALARLGKLTLITDTFDLIVNESNKSNEINLVDLSGDIFQSVWEEAAELRRNGRLFNYGKNIKCPVVAIHGDHDPHPAEGVQCLSDIVRNFRFILLKNCGHKPWVERQARQTFFDILKQEVR
ncbi:MAG: alpha/beta hydrolase [Candidatus Heimdallarchaeota archaeon]|nr:MAG: alpha/beta hydrolase [Candidatus Heimdallarchaeota archaeon]